jgi:hypothetical protein
MRPNRFTSRRLAAIFVPTAIALAACGGSDDVAPGAASPAAALSLTGTAATGAAIVGGKVEAKCAAGNGQTATIADGSYSLSIEGAALPCVLKVSKDGTVLHSLATGSGTSATANLTPVSDLIVARLALGNPADFYAGFDPAKAPDAAQVQAAVGAVLDTLKAAGIDLTGTDVLGGKLVAASGGTPGNDFDQKLDTLKKRLEDAGITLIDLRDTMVRESPAAPPTALNPTPSLPAELLLRPAAPNCKALRSGKYRLVFFMPGGAQAATDTIMLDAPTLTTTAPDGEISSLTADGECRYKLPNGGELLVSQAGVGAFRSLEDGTYRGAMVFPEQVHPVSALAGSWNYLGLGETSDGAGPVHLYLGDMAIDAAGAMTGGTFCDDMKSCVAEGSDPRMVFTANAQGGFNFDGGRAFAYRSGGGELMVVFIDEDGSFALATRKVARTLPDLGSVNRSWNFTITPQFTAPFLPNSSENTTVSQAADGRSYMRNAVIDFNNGATRPETVQINTPREGFSRRVPETVSTSAGGSSVVSEWVVLTLRGTGITPVAFPANNQLALSVNKPAP